VIELINRIQTLIFSRNTPIGSLHRVLVGNLATDLAPWPLRSGAIQYHSPLTFSRQPELFSYLFLLRHSHELTSIFYSGFEFLTALEALIRG